MRYIKFAWICFALALTACASGIKHEDMASSISATAAPPANQTAASVERNVFLPIEPGRDNSKPTEVVKVEFKLGLSSVTVERMVKQQGCESRFGAGLLASSGPVDVYRVSCVDGRELRARCEFRQCAILSEN